MDSQADYAEVGRLAQQVQADALAALAETVGADLLMVNPNSHALAHLMLIPDSFGLEERYGRQSVDGGILVHVDALPPYSVTPYGPMGFQLHDLAVSPHHLENDFLRVEFNDAGDMVRILDKEQGREVLPPGGLANQFQAFEDRPKQWDAWDVDIFYDDKMWLADPAALRRSDRGGAAAGDHRDHPAPPQQPHHPAHLPGPSQPPD